ncbi:lipocalin family protein [Chryseobacterium sp. MEBOG06]|uniref:lipocalin family protein n=1 Tax=unclassified Chryseobacterium TaxID=2593645 RepID=UPI001F2C215F|nr:MULTISPECIES: lipocalin family protein [unclassified Chryseobacterium]UKB83313.1 lipocalin family protein [Chryseobacterium sp. MEBOG06]
MKFFIGILFLLSFASCSSDDNSDVFNEEIKINGSWKPYKYEFRGKDIMVNDCTRRGQLFINANFSGLYERYDMVESSGNCNKVDSFTGSWSFDKLYSTLTLSYMEAGVSKIMKKEIDSYSDTELRLYDNSQNLDNVPGNDEAILVFRKE